MKFIKFKVDDNHSLSNFKVNSIETCETVYSLDVNIVIALSTNH
jgi:hypothetical protein